MTDNNDITEDDGEQFDEPEYREVGEREFLEGEVGAFVDEGEHEGDYVSYGDHSVPFEAVHALSEHDYHCRVQLDVVELEDDTCEHCGETFKDVGQHQRLSDCGDE